MSNPFRRARSPYWWYWYYDASGKRIFDSSETEDEEVAKQRLDAIRRRIAGEKRAGIKKPSEPTLRWYLEEKWLPERRTRGVRSVGDDENRLKHVLPRLGETLLKDISRPQLVDFMRHIMGTTNEHTGELPSPRLVRHIYGAIRVALNDAVADGLIQFSPATLKVRRGELPPKRDKRPGWRRQAVYSRAEVEMLISDARIPEYRRVLWGLIFIGCMRINEATPRRWRDYDTEAEPLHRLSIDSHWDVKLFKELPGYKTNPGGCREVPVHPTLAKLLARWRLSGWAAMNGRQPTPEDFIIEAPRGGPLNSNRTLEALKEDLAALGLRTRRQHDSRRTFISLARSSPLHNDTLLKFITHGPPESENILDDYTTPPWPELCAQVLLVKIGLLGGVLLEASCGTGVTLDEIPMNLATLQNGRGGTRILPKWAAGGRGERSSAHRHERKTPETATETPDGASECLSATPNEDDGDQGAP